MNIYFGFIEKNKKEIEENYEKIRKNRILIFLNKYDDQGMLRFRIECVRSLARESRCYEIRSR